MKIKIMLMITIKLIFIMFIRRSVIIMIILQ